MSEQSTGRSIRTLPAWAVVIVTVVVAGVCALVGGASGLAGHGIPYGGCSGFYPATCEDAFRAGVVIGGLGGLAISAGLAWPFSRRRRLPTLASGILAIVAIPFATYLVARTDPSNHLTGLSRMMTWVVAITVAAAAIAWLVATWADPDRNEGGLEPSGKRVARDS